MKNSNISEGVRKSWTDPTIREKRLQRHSVRVKRNGVFAGEFSSLYQAFLALGLPEKKHIPFRIKLKNEGSLSYAHHNDIFDFSIIESLYDLESEQINKENLNTMDKISDEIIFEGPSDDGVDEINIIETRNNIYTDQGDLEIDSLYNKYKRGRLDIQPEFQRQFVWDTAKSSRLIESALLEIPLPVLYISQEKDGKEYVIDGQQRLTSFFSFIDGKFPSGIDFRLTGLKVFPELNRKKFSDLTEEQQDKIRYCKIRTITFKKESDSNIKFEIFERLNTGSVSLNDQELRNCMYRGRYNDLLKELAADQNFLKLFKLNKPDNRMKDVELVLRFSAFYHQTYLNYKSPMRGFLNREMELYQNITKKDEDNLRTAFTNAIQVAISMLNQNAFKRFYKGTNTDHNGWWEPNKFNASLYDILMFSFAREEKTVLYRNLDSIREGFIYLMTMDQDFIESIEKSTSSELMIIRRFEKWHDTLKQIIGTSEKGDRCFSLSIKQQLFNNNQTCSICGQKIQSLDDSAVDHIEQYWRGGLTVPENAQLTHRYCNWSKPRL